MHRLAGIVGIFLSTFVVLAAAVTVTAAPAGQSPTPGPVGQGPTPVPSSQGSGLTLNLTAGNGSGVVAHNFFLGDGAVPPRAGTYFGSAVRVAVGTTVTWTGGSDEPHTVTFLAGKPVPPLVVPQPEDPFGRPPMFNPEFFGPSPLSGPWDGSTLVNSGELSQGEKFSLTFSREGTYPYLCLFHPDSMTGTVLVAASGPLTTQATIDQAVATHMSAVHDAQASLINSMRNTAGVADGPNGTQVWTARAGTEWHNGHLDIMAFMPSDVTIRQGDTVVWYADQNAPHTVTFKGDDNVLTDFIMVQMADGSMMSMDMMAGPPPPAAGPPDLATMPRFVVGPGTQPIKASPTHDGHSTYNSGLFGLHGNAPVGPGAPNTWSLTFDVPGAYQYTCVLHESLGMKGSVVVLPR
ncbi:MAG: rus [Chloroflexi bacterium]|nr:rus [Chloroflexota bacterium]